MQEVTLGGERLGSGKKNKIAMHGYERSTHDLSYILRTTMSAGTLVPFMSELALPGDTFDMELECDILTHPTIGPLFGSYKIQLDVFQVPIRLYQGKLHMNRLKVGLDMSKVPLPQLTMSAAAPTFTKPIDNQQINPSCILSYLGIRGLAGFSEAEEGAIQRSFNAVPYLAYWDIYKNYYANKQEEIGAVIHKNVNATGFVFANFTFNAATGVQAVPNDNTPPAYFNILLNKDSTFVASTVSTSQVKGSDFRIYVKNPDTNEEYYILATEMFEDWLWIEGDDSIYFYNPVGISQGLPVVGWSVGGATWNPAVAEDSEPEITTFPLENIDTMRQNIQSYFGDVPYEIEADAIAPYGLTLQKKTGQDVWAKQFNQEGLGLKTYQSDLFNNWIDTEWIDGEDGISAITAVDTSGGSFTIDELNLSKKIYDMLNRIALSDGTYDSWLATVYDHERTVLAQNPMYIGGLIKNLVFQEVISNAAANDQPLGTLAGRGRIGGIHKGGNIVAKINEPSYLIGIVSLTPLVDYSQGNKWDNNLRTMNDLHKPALDQIGFQDLITDQMTWWDTRLSETMAVQFKSAGKQPAWINYMTNINRTLGNFADETQQMYMTLNRKYTAGWDVDGPLISDLTTYIDPTHFNHIFADTRLDAQNFWTQIRVGMIARRKMSAKVIPNL